MGMKYTGTNDLGTKLWVKRDALWFIEGEKPGDLNVVSNDKKVFLEHQELKGKIEECVAHYSLKMRSQQET